MSEPLLWLSLGALAVQAALFLSEDLQPIHFWVLTLDDAKRAIRTVDPFAAIKDGLTKAPLDSNVVPLRKVTS